MTVKQFAYLAAGIVVGFICFSLPIFFIFKIIFGGLFALTGVFLAFVPVEGRSADTMITLFISALLKPNEFSYKKGQDSANVTVTPSQVKAEKQEKKEPEKNEKVFFASNPPASLTMPEESADADALDTSFTDASQAFLPPTPIEQPVAVLTVEEPLAAPI